MSGRYLPTTNRAWPRYRPDYWAGEIGGRPLPKRAPYPLRGDTLPREDAHHLRKAFTDHSQAVAYAKLFNNHAQITTSYREDNLGIRTKLFIVNPHVGKPIYTRTQGIRAKTNRRVKNKL